MRQLQHVFGSDGIDVELSEQTVGLLRVRVGRTSGKNDYRPCLWGGLGHFTAVHVTGNVNLQNEWWECDSNINGHLGGLVVQPFEHFLVWGRWPVTLSGVADVVDLLVNQREFIWVDIGVRSQRVLSDLLVKPRRLREHVLEELAMRASFLAGQ